MKKIVVCLLAFALLLSVFSVNAESPEAQVSFRFLTAEETAETLMGLDEYYAQLNQKSLDFFHQKKGATVQEYKEYSAAQATNFTEDQQLLISTLMGALETQLASLGIVLPENTEIRFAATTAQEVGGAGGYTHGDTVFLNGQFLNTAMMMIGTENEDAALTTTLRLLAHELFHVLTRKNPDFRAKMYSVIGFTVQDAEVQIPDEIREQMISNPDVERHDSTAMFTINGKPTECFLVFLTKDEFENPGDTFFTNAYSGLVSVEDGTLYTTGDASDFWETVGKNTTYVEDPEECMADNFSYALVYGYNAPVPTPEIQQHIIDLLK